MTCSVRHTDALAGLQAMPEGSVDVCMTSPPYWGLRDYGGTATVWGGDPDCRHVWGDSLPGNSRGGSGTPTDKNNRGEGYGRAAGRGRWCQLCGAWHGQLGLEPCPSVYLEHLWMVFDEVKRVLKPRGTCWVVLGDTYGAQKGNAWLRPKQLLLIPPRFAIGMQERGWLLRNDIVWCLSGGTWLYVRSQKGDMPMTVKDLARLRPETVQLWNGQRWVRLLGISKTRRNGEQLELVLRSGERISCTPNHKFPTDRGLLEAGDLRKGDRLWRVRLPEPDAANAPDHIGADAAWFVGLYIADGSRAGDTIQFAGHVKENERWARLQRIARAYGGSITRTISGNRMDIRMYGKLLAALLDQFVSGRTAIDKGLRVPVWQYGDAFLEQVLQGYLSGDGHCDEKNQRWRINFCRNYKWEKDLRTLCARLGYSLVLKQSTVKYRGGERQVFRGEIRFNGRRQPTEEIVAVRRGKCLSVYDLGVEGEPHTFALASGILTHNSKPNPMPASARDRFTCAWEHVFMFARSGRYFFNMEDSLEVGATGAWEARPPISGVKQAEGSGNRTYSGNRPPSNGQRQPRDVWTISTACFPEAHFAVFPEQLVRKCLMAGGPPRVCAKCGKPWRRDVQFDAVRERWPGLWLAACDCGEGWQPGLVLDPFTGSGTTGKVAVELGLRFLGLEISAEYVAMAEKRISTAQPPLHPEAT